MHEKLRDEWIATRKRHWYFSVRLIDLEVEHGNATSILREDSRCNLDVRAQIRYPSDHRARCGSLQPRTAWLSGCATARVGKEPVAFGHSLYGHDVRFRS